MEYKCNFIYHTYHDSIVILLFFKSTVGDWFNLSEGCDMYKYVFSFYMHVVWQNIPNVRLSIRLYISHMYMYTSTSLRSWYFAKQSACKTKVGICWEYLCIFAICTNVLSNIYATFYFRFSCTLQLQNIPNLAFDF